MKNFKVISIVLLGTIYLAAACSASFNQSLTSSASPNNFPNTPSPPATHDPKECAASAVARLGPDLFLVGGDEDNNLRLYSTADFNTIKSVYPLAPIFRSIKDPSILDSPKTDIEGAAWLGNIVYFIGSHSMNTEGTKDKPERRRIFAVEIKYTEDGITLNSVGTPYSKLVENLNSDPQYQNYHLDKAAKIGSKTAGGLSIEGLAQGENNSLLIGFRNPIIKDKALIAVILNPREILENKEPQFGRPIELNLGGLGIRDLTWSKERNSYFIIAGQFGAENPAFRLYEWSGKSSDAAKQVETNQLQGLNPEAVAAFPAATTKSGARLLILNDNEKDTVCSEKGFGGIWIDMN